MSNPRLILAKKGIDVPAGGLEPHARPCPGCHAIPRATLKEAHRIFEKGFIAHTLKRSAGDLRHTAAALDVSVSTLKARIGRHGIDLLDSDLMADAVWSFKSPSLPRFLPPAADNLAGSGSSPMPRRAGQDFLSDTKR